MENVQPAYLLKAYDRVRRHFVKELYDLHLVHPSDLAHPTLKVQESLQGILLDNRHEVAKEVEQVSAILAVLAKVPHENFASVNTHVLLTIHRLLVDFESFRKNFLRAMSENSKNVAIAISGDPDLRARIRSVLGALDQDPEWTVRERASQMLDELSLREPATVTVSTSSSMAITAAPDSYIVYSSDWPRTIPSVPLAPMVPQIVATTGPGHTQALVITVPSTAPLNQYPAALPMTHQRYPSDFYKIQEPQYGVTQAPSMPSMSSVGHQNQHPMPVQRASSQRSINKSCGECGTTSSPEWRTGPAGTKLCNACGLRYRRRNQQSAAQKGNGLESHAVGTAA